MDKRKEMESRISEGIKGSMDEVIYSGQLSFTPFRKFGACLCLGRFKEAFNNDYLTPTVTYGGEPLPPTA